MHVGLHNLARFGLDFTLVLVWIMGLALIIGSAFEKAFDHDSTQRHDYNAYTAEELESDEHRRQHQNGVYTES